MQGLEQILGSTGTDIGGIASRFGLRPDQAQLAMGALLPAVLGGMHQQAGSGGLDQVAAAAAGREPDAETGNDILGRIFGSKDVSRQVADHAAAQSGVASGVLKAMLPVVAAMVARHAVQRSGQQGGGGGLGGVIGSMLGGVGDGGLGGMLGSVLGGGGGNPLDAILHGQH